MASKVDVIKRKIRKIRGMQQQQSEDKGRRRGLMNRLVDKFKVDTLDAGADLLEEYVLVVENNNKKLDEVDGELDEITQLAEANKEIK